MPSLPCIPASLFTFHGQSSPLSLCTLRTMSSPHVLTLPGQNHSPGNDSNLLHARPLHLSTHMRLAWNFPFKFMTTDLKWTLNALWQSDFYLG
jgi:hypothetical protein